jgi:hypothetical protein
VKLASVWFFVKKSGLRQGIITVMAIRKMKAKDLVRLCGDVARARRHFWLNDLKSADVRVEYQKSGGIHVLADLRPSLSVRGTPTFRTIQAIEDGQGKYYDGNYEFNVTALLIGDERCPFDVQENI